MSTIHSIELFTAINLGMVGLSHFLQPKIWAEFFSYLHSRKNVGNIINALMALGVGSIILSFHFVWLWPKVIITIYGISQVLKGLLYLIFPSIGIASIGRVNIENASKFRWAGLAMFLFSLWIVFKLISESAFGS